MPSLQKTNKPSPPPCIAFRMPRKGGGGGIVSHCECQQSLWVRGGRFFLSLRHFFPGLVPPAALLFFSSFAFFCGGEGQHGGERSEKSRELILNKCLPFRPLREFGRRAWKGVFFRKGREKSQSIRQQKCLL